MSDVQQVGVAQGPDGASRLLKLATLAAELGSEHVASESSELAARLAEGRFFVACVGQFKRGKSTLARTNGTGRGGISGRSSAVSPRWY